MTKVEHFVPKTTIVNPIMLKNLTKTFVRFIATSVLKVVFVWFDIISVRKKINIETYKTDRDMTLLRNQFACCFSKIDVIAYKSNICACER